MKSPPWARRLIPTALGAAMLAVIVVAALTPNIGVGAAQPPCQYNCTNPQNNTLEYALIGVLVAGIVAALLALLIFQRRKRRGPGGGAGAVAAWEEPSGGSSGPGGTMDSSTTGDYSTSPPGGATTYGAAGVAAGATAYDEAPAPAEPGPDWAEAAAPPTIGSSAVIDEAEPDIDRLMKELDQISDDILKKTPLKKAPPPEPGGDDAPSET
ncbi:MAG: hypothetical protein L3K14_06745 [Thermoplasmata archaeon]|nr:hypothetical protein [Thermoplasmata archaeon]